MGKDQRPLLARRIKWERIPHGSPRGRMSFGEWKWSSGKILVDPHVPTFALLWVVDLGIAWAIRPSRISTHRELW